MSKPVSVFSIIRNLKATVREWLTWHGLTYLTDDDVNKMPDGVFVGRSYDLPLAPDLKDLTRMYHGLSSSFLKAALKCKAGCFGDLRVSARQECGQRCRRYEVSMCIN